MGAVLVASQELDVEQEHLDQEVAESKYRGGYGGGGHRGGYGGGKGISRGHGGYGSKFFF